MAYLKEYQRSKQSISQIIPQVPNSSPTKQYSQQIYDKFHDRFYKNIEQVTNIQQQLAEIKMNQKCLQHNSNYALYCQRDNKILCTECMYKNNQHVNHPVKPVNSSLENLRKDVHKSEKEIHQLMEKINKYKQCASAQIQTIDKLYPPTKTKIQQLFRTLHQHLNQLQKQCINQLKLYKSHLLSSSNLIKTELDNINKYLFQKIKKYENKKQLDQLILKKNIYDILKKIPKIIHEELKVQIYKNQKIFKFHQVDVQNQIKSAVKKNIWSWLPWNKKIDDDCNVSKGNQVKDKIVDEIELTPSKNTKSREKSCKKTKLETSSSKLKTTAQQVKKKSINICKTQQNDQQAKPPINNRQQRSLSLTIKVQKYDTNKNKQKIIQKAVNNIRQISKPKSKSQVKIKVNSNSQGEKIVYLGKNKQQIQTKDQKENNNQKEIGMGMENQKKNKGDKVNHSRKQ